MRRPTSPPLSPSSPRATQPPPLSIPGLIASRDKAGASTHTLPPPRDDFSIGQPLQRENSETRLLDFEIALTKLETYAQAMKNNNLQIKDPGVRKKVTELFGKMYQKLSPELQEQVRDELDAIFQDAGKENEPPQIIGTSTKRLISWTIDNLVLPLGLGILMFIISLYFNKAV